MVDKEKCVVKNTPLKCFFSSPVMALFYIVYNTYKQVHGYIKDHNFQAMHVFYTLFGLTLLPLIIFNFEGAKMVGVVLILLSPLWLTTALVLMIWGLWMDYINLLFLSEDKQESVLLEIKVPKSVQKSPAAMELFFNGLLLSQGETTGFDLYWKGRVKPWWSVEIVGKNGEVRMYIWCWRRFKEHLEAQLYAQFPEVELVETEDYAYQTDYDPKKQFAFGTRFKLDADEALPIKTYFDYGLHENADKWETKIDPMVNILEKFALAKEGEQMWMQILFQKSNRKTADEAQSLIEKIYKDKTPEYPDPHDKDKTLQGMAMLTPNEREMTEAIQRASKKPAFDCIIRAWYIADLEHMNTLRIQSFGKMFNYYDGHNKINAFEGKGPGGDYPWEAYTLPHWPTVLTKFLKAYRLRSGFNVPYKRPSITLTSEELATIFHFPSEEGAIPGMEKKQAKSAAPPTNLPI